MPWFTSSSPASAALAACEADLAISVTLYCISIIDCLVTSATSDWLLILLSTCWTFSANCWALCVKGATTATTSRTMPLRIWVKILKCFTTLPNSSLLVMANWLVKSPSPSASSCKEASIEVTDLLIERAINTLKAVIKTNKLMPNIMLKSLDSLELLTVSATKFLNSVAAFFLSSFKTLATSSKRVDFSFIVGCAD